SFPLSFLLPLLILLSANAFLRVDFSDFLRRLWTAGVDARTARASARARDRHRLCGLRRNFKTAVHSRAGLAAARLHTPGLLADRTVFTAIGSLASIQTRSV